MIFNLRQMGIFLLIALFLCACSYEKNSSADYDLTNTDEQSNMDISQRTLTLCDLGKNASKLDGKIVRLKTRLVFGTENATFSDEKCSYFAVITFADKSAYDEIDKAAKESGHSSVYGIYYDIEVEGKFINKPFTGCCTIAPFQFDITKTYTAQPVKPN